MKKISRETLIAGLKEGVGVFLEETGLDENGEAVYKLLPLEQVNQNLLKVMADQGVSPAEIERWSVDLKNTHSTPLPPWYLGDHPDAYAAALVYAQVTVNGLTLKAVSKKCHFTRRETCRLFDIAQKLQAEWIDQHE
ncbi:MAG: hypothetical protein ABI947_12825 [Chloroflexota bacterium]